MKAYQVTAGYSIASLAITDKPLPRLLPNQLLVKLQSISFNYRDLLVIKGIDSWKPPVGRVPVSDGVGTIVAAGVNATCFAMGDRVAGLFLPNWIDGKLTANKLMNPLGGRVKDGLLQEYAVFDENELIKVPDYLTNEEAATLPCAALTAWNGLIEKRSITADDTVLIQGTGGVSLFSIQFAHMVGAKVILLSGSDEKLQLAKGLGVNHLINYKQMPNWEKEVLNITNGLGVDHVVEIVGGDHINRSIEVAAYEGTISLIGLIGGLSGTINTSQAMAKQLTLQGIEVGSKAMFNRMNKAMELSQIHPVISKVYAFSEAKEALTSLEQGTHFGKIGMSF